MWYVQTSERLVRCAVDCTNWVDYKLFMAHSILQIHFTNNKIKVFSGIIDKDRSLPGDQNRVNR
jgi:hypothetical protein